MKIIAVSACALPENFSQCLKAGFDHQLEKPVTIDSLRNLLSGFGWPRQE
jgi:CheY-like chemotaxis protein